MPIFTVQLNVAVQAPAEVRPPSLSWGSAKDSRLQPLAGPCAITGAAGIS